MILQTPLSPLSSCRETLVLSVSRLNREERNWRPVPISLGQPIDAIIVDTLQRNRPCLNDLVTCLLNYSWVEILDALDRMSRDKRAVLSLLDHSTYQLSLVPPRQLAHIRR